MSDRKRQVVDFLKAFETGAPEPLGIIDADNYTQHNLSAADGLAGFRELTSQMPAGSVKVNTIRVLQDGDYVVAHSEFEIFGPITGFDIFRFSKGKIVEHWDNLQKSGGPNPSGNTMTDGSTAVTNLNQTAENKALVRRFVDDVLVNERMEKLPGYYHGDHYIQHNPQIANGLSGLAAGLDAMRRAGITMKYDRIHAVFGEGNFVLVVSEGEFARKPASFYDLFRVENGKISEHWDTIEAIPPRSEWRNQNGKFGFPGS